MLVLKRKLGQRVIISFNGAEMIVTPQEFDNQGVRLSFEGPVEVKVLREELVRTPPKGGSQ